MTPELIAAVASPRPLYRHVGLLVKWPNQAPLIFSVTPSQGSRWYTVDEFADGRGIVSLAAAPGWDCRIPPSEVIRRAAQMHSTRYDLFQLNCEHVVKWLIGQEVASPQLQGMATAAAIMVAMFGLTRLAA